MLQGTMELVLEFASPDTFPSGTVTIRVSSLHHKARDHAVEDNAIVVAVLAVHREILRRLRALLKEDLDDNVPKRSVERGRLGKRVIGSDGCGQGRILLRGLFIEDI